MIKNVGNFVADISDSFESNNGSAKISYLKININKFREIAKSIEFNRGNFATGYPFYAIDIDQDSVESLPIIAEQIRYNAELRIAEQQAGTNIWICEECLKSNGRNMPDLKQVCKPCPKIDARLKPRKVINRLPDLDMWLICENGKMEECSRTLQHELYTNRFKTSDVNPIQTIYDIEKIVQLLNCDEIPDLLLPIDVHIVEYDVLLSKIASVPDAIADSLLYGHPAYIPILPLSFRKTWHFDDEAYNFVSDFLACFTESNLDTRMQSMLNDARFTLISKYNPDELYSVLLKTLAPSTLRRFNTKQLKRHFQMRVESWKK